MVEQPKIPNINARAEQPPCSPGKVGLGVFGIIFGVSILIMVITAVAGSPEAKLILFKTELDFDL